MGFEDELKRVIEDDEMAEMVTEEYSEDTIKSNLQKAIFGKYKRDYVRNLLSGRIEDVYELSDSSWKPDLPDTDQNVPLIVRRYIDISKFSSLLDSGLYFNRIDKFSDSFEGTVSGYTRRKRHDQEHFQKSELDPSALSSTSYEATKDKIIRKQSYASCWRFGGEESAVFWDAYIGDGNGIAIETSLDNLKSLTEKSNREIMLGKVNYEEYKGGSERFAEDHVARVFHKRFAFEDERELRLLTRQSVNSIDIEVSEDYMHATIDSKIDADSGLKLDIDPNALIDKILLSPYMNDRMIGQLCKLVDYHDLDVEILRSRLDVDPRATSPVEAFGKNEGTPTDPDLKRRRQIDQSKWL